MVSSKVRNASTKRYSNDSIEVEVRTDIWHFPLLMPLNQQAEKRVTVLAGVIDPDYLGETELLLHNGGKVRNTGDPLGFLLALP